MTSILCLLASMVYLGWILLTLFSYYYFYYYYYYYYYYYHYHYYYYKFLVLLRTLRRGLKMGLGENLLPFKLLNL